MSVYRAKEIMEEAQRFDLCRRHLSRRAVGFCESCRNHLCRACVLDGHDCAGSVPEVEAAPGGSLGNLLIALATTVVLVFSVYGAAKWANDAQQQPSDQRPPAVGTARADIPPTIPNEPLPSNPDPPAQAQPVHPEPQMDPSSGDHPFPAQPSGRSLNRGPSQQRVLLLSFDAGSHVTGAQRVLDILATAGVKTTFFVTGDFIREHPELVRRLVADGHEVGNHLDTHPHLTMWGEQRRQLTRGDVDQPWLQGQLRRTALEFRNVTGKDMAPLWRAPFGEYNHDILQWAAREGWQHVGWTHKLDTLDWVTDPGARNYRSAEEIADRLLAFPQTDPQDAHGAIVLMHLGSDRPVEDHLSQVLPRILYGYREKGFEFVKASDMMRGS